MVIAEEPTRKVIKMMTQQQWRRLRTVGSHSMWVCSTGTHQVSIPDGHRMISPGVLRNINNAVAGCSCQENQA